VKQAEEGNAWYEGLQTCGSVWECPVCSGKISQRRRLELNELLKWCRGMGYDVQLLTLTFRHDRELSLVAGLDLLKRAKKRMHQSYWWKRKVTPQLIGHVTATEVTHGDNGWHPHLHMLVVVDTGSAAVVDGLRSTWEHSLEAFGGSCNEHGFRLQNASEAGKYISKWGAAEEMSLSGSKSSNGGRNPWQLLASYGDGDKQAGALFIEYVEAFEGKKQLSWSNGLKAAVGIVDVCDSDIVADEGREDEGKIVAVIPPDLWRKICEYEVRADLLNAVEDGRYQEWMAAFKRKIGYRSSSGERNDRQKVPEGVVYA